MNFWDDKFNIDEYLYGKEANSFLKEILMDLPKGKILFVCEGEGRNSVYAAKLGFEVFAFDSSSVGRDKALRLANDNDVNIEYDLRDALDIDYPENTFDYIVLIFAHFPSEIRQSIHHKLYNCLNNNGKIIMEAFNPKQLDFTSGGPKNIDMLYTKTLIQNDFPKLEILLLEEKQIILNEGDLHQGQAEVVRFIGKKSIS